MAAQHDGSHKSSSWVVLKFGGSSVATAERWQTIARVVRARLEEGVRPLVVCSALSGVSNLLADLLHEAERGRQPDELLEQVRAKHHALGEGLGLDVTPLVGAYLEELERLISGARLIGEVSPQLRARVMSAGELMSTRIGAEWMSAQGLATAWWDARELLQAQPAPAGASPSRHFLSATCDTHADPALVEQLTAAEGAVAMTQGFIARDADGATVLLGRGGSDTSAAYLAARVQAQRLEIWTDVPGMFTCNPRDFPNARLLRQLGYEEAQVLAAMGARVLHPPCIQPVQDHDIPLHICWTNHPHVQGTVISREAETEEPTVKAVAARHEIYLLRIRCPGFWHLVGLLADVTGVFKRHGLSIDLIANSASRISLTLDPVVSPVDAGAMQRLLEDLQAHGTTEASEEVASVSLVGSNIGSLMHKLAPSFEHLGSERIRLVSQAASDDGLSFVLDKEAVDHLVRPLHNWLLTGDLPESVFGPSWEELMRQNGDGLN